MDFLQTPPLLTKTSSTSSKSDSKTKEDKTKDDKTKEEKNPKDKKAVVDSDDEDEEETKEKNKERLEDIAERLKKFIESQKLSDQAKVDLTKLDPQNLNEYLSIVNSELTSDYINIRKLTSKQLRTILMNFGCYYGRIINEQGKFEFPIHNLFKELPDEYEFPAKAIICNERPRIIAQEFNNARQVELNNWNISGIQFSAKIPIVFNNAEQRKASGVLNQKTNTNSKIIHGGYYCPKGTVLLREINKELSDEAKDFFQENEELTLARAEEFYQTFGTIVPTEIVVGGELTRNEEVKQDTSVKGEEKNKDSNLKMYGLVQTWLLSAGYAGKSKETNKDASASVSQEMSFVATGGDEKYITDVTKWMKSLDNSETWRLIRVNKWRYTYEFLDPVMKRQFQSLRDDELAKLEKGAGVALATHPLNNNIVLADQAPEALTLYKTCLCAFFPYAMHYLPLAGIGREEKVPMPWKTVRSAVTIFPMVYVSTPQGIFQLDLMSPPVLIKKDFPMCILLAYDGNLFALADKVVKIDLETKEMTVWSHLDLRNAVSGLVHENAGYVINGGNLWKIDFTSRVEKKIALPMDCKNPQAIVGSNEETKAYIISKKLWSLDLETEKCKLLDEDHRYPHNLSAVYLAANKEIYVATKRGPKECDEPVSFYKVQIDGSREIMDVEWDCSSHSSIIHL